jgi:NAD-dependent deacetylase
VQSTKRPARAAAWRPVPPAGDFAAGKLRLRPDRGHARRPPRLDAASAFLAGHHRDERRRQDLARVTEVTVTDAEALDHLAGRLRSARAIAVMTGAGISAESGIPTFRGADGLWHSYSATDLATPEAFARDPGLVWQWYRWRQGIIGRAQPNPGHLALARLQARMPGFTLITQNVDGLHQRAGSSNVIELHGNIWRARCSRWCGLVTDEACQAPGDEPAGARNAVPACQCGAALRPDIVWFGESLDQGRIDAALRAAGNCDVFLAVGTSALVYPAAGLPLVAGRAGAWVAEINVDDTPLTPHVALALRGKAAELLPALESRL